MANVKISQEPSDSAPAASDYLLGNKASGGPTTQTFLLSALATFFWTLANIPTGATSPITRDNESQFAFVASGLVWSGDSYNVNHNASMTAGVVYINGRRISISAVTARTFTISKDTYVDILDNGDGTGTIVYTEVANNAASPVLAANSIRIAIIITSATVIVNSGSVNQGQETKLLPIASSIPYTTTDSLGNLICTRDPSNRTLAYRQDIGGGSTASASYVDYTILNFTLNAPANRKLRLTLNFPSIYSSADGNGGRSKIVDVTSSVSSSALDYKSPSVNGEGNATFAWEYTPPAGGARNFKVQWFALTGGTIAANPGPNFKAELA